MEAPAQRAHIVLPPDTRDISKVVIYVESTDKGLYFHSNYLSRAGDGTVSENPTKILTDETSDLLTIFDNIVYWGESITPEEREVASATLRDDVTIYLNQNVFDAGGYPKVDIHGATHVSVVTSSGFEPIGKSAEVLNRVAPPPVLMSKVLGCCLYGIPPHLAAQYYKALEARPLNGGGVRLLSLVRESGTKEVIKESSTLTKAYLGDSRDPVTNLAQIEKAFNAARGSTIVLVSHVEGEDFVIRDAGNAIVSSIPVRSVRDLASKYNVELIDLGCETAQTLKAESLGIGVTTKFNTVDAMRALDRALSQSSSYADFFEKLTSENLKVVIDKGFTQGWPLCADVYAKTNRPTVWVKLARIFVGFRQERADFGEKDPNRFYSEKNPLFKYPISSR